MSPVFTVPAICAIVRRASSTRLRASLYPCAECSPSADGRRSVSCALSSAPWENGIKCLLQVERRAAAENAPSCCRARARAINTRSHAQGRRCGWGQERRSNHKADGKAHAEAHAEAHPSSPSALFLSLLLPSFSPRGEMRRQHPNFDAR